MIRLRLLFSIICFSVVALSVAIGCAWAQSQTSTKPGTGLITGHVTLDGKPAPGVLIVLAPCEDGNPKNYSPPLNSVTDGDGQFRLEGISAGQYCIDTYAPALVSASRRDYRQKVLKIADGETVDGIDLALQKGGVITGRITDADDRQLIQEPVFVYAYNERDPNLGLRTVKGVNTDDRGIYRVYGLAPGHYLVSAGAVQPGAASTLDGQSNYVRTFYPNTIDIHQAKKIDLSADQEISDIDIAVGRRIKGYSISGNVIDADKGVSLPNLRVTCILYFEDGKRPVQYRPADNPTDQKGEFVVDNLGPGHYGIQLAANDGSAYYSDVLRFEITDSNVRGLTVKAVRSATISGTVVFDGIFDGISDSATISQISKAIIIGRSYSTKPDGLMSSARSNIAPNGTFKLVGLEPGRVVFGVNIPDAPGTQGLTLLRVEGESAAGRFQINLQPGESPSDIRLVFGFATGVVHATVRVAGMDVPVNMRIMLAVTDLSRDKTVSHYFLDGRNQVSTTNLLPGQYEFSTSCQWSAGPETVSLESEKQIIDVTNGSEQTITITATIKPLKSDKP